MKWSGRIVDKKLAFKLSCEMRWDVRLGLPFNPNDSDSEPSDDDDEPELKKAKIGASTSKETF